ncbi:hypothetical protein CSUB01_06083 [Colletotrichum sublineola]|uniref:Uncharacterized protein n=1 Tax=Colletotrichum sublineola TaxID=1173701 RepID=A0A066WX40_COLSU|nr:hypothetical protein CSUB01_06083 [Colletotrichum sublineola]
MYSLLAGSFETSPLERLRIGLLAPYDLLSLLLAGRLSTRLRPELMPGNTAASHSILATLTQFASDTISTSPVDTCNQTC